MYREETLGVSPKSPKRRRSAMVREEHVVPTSPNLTWATDFMHDMLADGS